jgi:hypothetical protein
MRKTERFQKNANIALTMILVKNNRKGNKMSYDKYIAALNLSEEDSIFVKELLNLARAEGVRDGFKEAREVAMDTIGAK